jgi:hypothetical protein
VFISQPGPESQALSHAHILVILVLLQVVFGLRLMLRSHVGRHTVFSLGESVLVTEGSVKVAKVSLGHRAINYPLIEYCVVKGLGELVVVSVDLIKVQVS